MTREKTYPFSVRVDDGSSHGGWTLVHVLRLEAEAAV